MSAARNPGIEDQALKLELRLAHLEKNEACRNNFLIFVKTVWPNFITGRHHRIIADKLERVARGELKRLIINMAPRHCLRVDTPLLTTSGWKTMSTVQPGDFVFGPDGNPTQVLGKSQIHKNRPLWEVLDTYGNAVYCDDGHIWTVGVDRKRPSVFKNKTAKELGERQKGTSEGRRAWIPDHTALNYKEANLPVDPYLFGVWLGDGAALQATISGADTDAVFIREEIENRGYITKDRATRYTFGVSKLKVPLRELGVLGNKHIPALYLRASIDQRLSLLKGIMDTDGNVTKGGQCFLATSSPILRDQYLELVWGLGIKAGLCTSRAVFNGRDYGETYRIGFYHNDVAYLPRKQDRAIGYSKPVRRYVSFTPAGVGDVQCIEVARPDGLFLAGHALMVTHNTKSEFASYLFPAWMMGRNPNMKIIQATHTTELAVNFGRKTKNLIESDPFKDIFPGVNLASDSKASGRWDTSNGGMYYAVGVGSNLAGRGGDLVIIDDPHSEQTAMSAKGFEDAWDWYTGGPRQRLQPGGSIVLVQTRWSEKDMTGQLLRAMAKDPLADQWEVVELPAIFEDGTPCWPEFWPLGDLTAVRASIPLSKWNAQYQQNPTGEESAIIKREWWRCWEQEKIPDLEYVIQSYDTAFSKRETSDYSAITTWGVFYPNEGGSGPNLILLDSKKGRWDFPELKQVTLDSYKFWEPDTVIVEAKASGLPLTHELRNMGIPVVNFTPSRGNDKISRVHSVSPLFEAGMVWAPDETFSDELIEEVASFPNGEHDDLVDSMTQALMRYRQGNFVRLPTDDCEDEDNSARVLVYY